MAYSVNWITKVVLIPASDLTLVSGTHYQLNMDNFLAECRRLEWDQDDGLWAPNILDHTNAKNNFAGANYAGFDEVVNGYTVEIGSGPTRVDIVGSNNNVVDVLVLTGITVVPSNSTGLTNINELRSMSFIGKEGKGVSIKPTTGIDGNAYPIGSAELPCKTEENIHDIGGTKYRNVYVGEDLLLTIDHSRGHTFFGQNPAEPISVTIGDSVTYPAKDVTGCKFQDLYVQGELDSANILWECIVGPIQNANKFIYKSALIGPIVVSENILIWRCSIAPDAPNQECIIDFNNIAKTVIISELGAGRIVVKNMVTGSFIGVAGTGGRLVIDAANTGGTAVYAGSVLVDDTYEANIDLLQNSSVAGATWDHQIEGTYTAEEVLRLIASVTSANASGLIDGNPIFRDLLDTKDRVTSTVVSGTRTVTLDAS